MSPLAPAHRLDALIASWERQQDGYVAHRAERFEIVADAIDYAHPDVRTIVDLGGGLGSFSRLLLERFPATTVITLDYDPSLLELARHNLRDFAGRSEIVEADLTDPAWYQRLHGLQPDAIVSSTALHWLGNSQLVSLYERLFTVLGEGGLFFNADHLPHAAEGSFFHRVSLADNARQQRAFAADAVDWQGWWDEFEQLEGFADLIAERHRRFADRVEHLDPTAALHTEALRVAGFTESGVIWQYFDDYVVYGLR